MPRTYDLCVVGTGPSAFFLVNKYLKKNPSSKVLVLEAGTKEIDNTTSLSHRESIDLNFKLSPTINIGLGGTSQLWHNVLSPLDKEDFEKHSWMPNSGWCISKITLDPYYKEVADFFRFSFDVFKNPSDFCDFKSEMSKVNFDQKIFDYKVFVHPSKYLRTSNSFKLLSKLYPGINIKYGSVALKFEEFEEKNELHIFDRALKQHSKVLSKNFVLCCGALNSPEILLNSNHIKERLPVIGKFLMDHPMGNFYQYEYEKPLTAKIFSGIKIKKGVSIKIALKLKHEEQKKNHLANSAFYLRPSFEKGFNNRSEDLKNKLLTVRSKLKKFKLPLSESFALIKDFNIAAQIIQYKTGFLSKHSLTDCMFVTEQRPSLESNIQLTNELNEYGNKKTKIKWNLSDVDLEEVTKFKSFIDKNLMFLNNASSTYDSDKYEWKKRLSSAAHHLGTIRMSDNSETGCVDENLKLHGFSDIYICDGSVFPTSGNANPTMTCMALASRLGEFLQND